MKITDLSTKSKSDSSLETLSVQEATKITGGMGVPEEGGENSGPCNGGWYWRPLPSGGWSIPPSQ